MGEKLRGTRTGGIEREEKKGVKNRSPDASVAVQQRRGHRKKIAGEGKT